MWSWLDSFPLQTLESIKQVCQTAAFFLAVLAPLLGLTAYQASRRADSLKAHEQKTQKDISDKHIGELQGEIAKERGKRAEIEDAMKRVETRAESVSKKVQETNAKAQDAAERALEITNKMGPRNLTKEQASAIVGELSKYRGQRLAIDISLDAEAQQYGNQVVDTLQRAGWVITVNAFGVRSPPMTGVTLCEPDAHAGAAIMALRRALEHAGIAVDVLGPQGAQGEANLIIAPKSSY